MQNFTYHNGKLNVDQAESAKEREKKKGMEGKKERVAATHAAESPYIDLSVGELGELVYLMTGDRTRNKNFESPSQD